VFFNILQGRILFYEKLYLLFNLKTMTYFLKERFYYENKYDKIIIDRVKPKKEFKNKQEEAINKYCTFLQRWHLLDKRNEVINRWIDEATKKDIFYESCKPFYDIKCRKCLINLIPEETNKTYMFPSETNSNKEKISGT